MDVSNGCQKSNMVTQKKKTFIKGCLFKAENKSGESGHMFRTNIAALHVQTSAAVLCLRGMYWNVMGGDVAVAGVLFSVLDHVKSGK